MYGTIKLCLRPAVRSQIWTRKLLATAIAWGRVYSSAIIPLRLRVKKVSISNPRGLVVVCGGSLVVISKVMRV